MSLIVRSPTTSISSPERGCTRLPTKRSSGYCATSKKSADFRCPSRSATPVSMLDESIVTSTVAFEKSPSGTCTVPDQRVNDPRTFAITRCRTEKCTLEWLLSISQRSVLMMPPDLYVPSSGCHSKGNESAKIVGSLFSITYRAKQLWPYCKDYQNDRIDYQFETDLGGRCAQLTLIFTSCFTFFLRAD